MLKSRKRVATLVASLLALMAFAGSVASPAMATESTAKFGTFNGLRITSLAPPVLYYNGAKPMNCSLEDGSAESIFGVSESLPSYFFLSSGIQSSVHLICGGWEKTLTVKMSGDAMTDGTNYWLQIGPQYQVQSESPWGPYYQDVTVKLPWHNGNALQPSGFYFDTVQIGTLPNGVPLSLAGAFIATTRSGQLQTLTP